MQCYDTVNGLTTAALEGLEHYVVKMTSTGIALATSGDALSVIVGSLQSGTQVLGVGRAPVAGVALKKRGIHFATLGASTAAINSGDLLGIDPSNPGQVIPVGGGTAIAMAWDPVPLGAGQGAQFNILFL